MIVEVRTYESGTLKAFADVTIPTQLGEVTLKGFRIVQKDGAEAWVAFPTVSYEKDGERVNKPVLEMPIGTRKLISDAILSEFKTINELHCG